MNKIIITIDGYSSCGKSTLAGQLAHELNYVFIDSGAMYRAITLYFLQNGIDWAKEEDVVKALQQIDLEFKHNASAQKSDIYLNRKNVADVIRDMPVSDNVSDVSTIKAVREYAVAQQQKMGVSKGLVMDGRDIGTTVFPDAELKIFVTAAINERVQRRFSELMGKNIPATLEDVKQNLTTRDLIDSTREISPLRKAEDALVLDNSKLNKEEQLAIVLQWAKNLIEKGH